MVNICHAATIVLYTEQMTNNEKNHYVEHYQEVSIALYNNVENNKGLLFSYSDENVRR